MLLRLLAALTLKQKIMIGVFILLVITIPTGSYVISQSMKNPDSNTSDFGTQFPVTSPKEVPKDSPLTGLEKDVKEATSTPTPNPITVQTPSTDSATLLLAPSLSFKILLEGRPINDQTAKIFLGIAQGQTKSNPKYLLSFVLNINSSGIFKDFSLPGLDNGTTYTAYLKGPAQIATSSSFVARTAPIDLGTLSMTTGDVNDDNIINTSDQNLLRAVMGAYPSADKWNPIYDFNLDQRINTLDLTIITRNLNKTGASGPWMSGIPQATKSATLSGSLVPDIGTPETESEDKKGYWMWMPIEF